MPCITEPPSHEENERKRLNELLDEAVGLEPHLERRPFFIGYTRKATLDELTARLCTWSEAHQEQIPRMSLEFQIWWRDHQRWDAKRRADAAAELERRESAERALRKLTEEDRKALGLMR